MFEKFKESDIEKAFCDYIGQGQFSVIGRQVVLPLGRIDILLSWTNPHGICPVIVEVKKGKIDLSACGQLYGYIGQVDYLIGSMFARNYNHGGVEFRNRKSIGILVGDSIDSRASRIIKSTDVWFYKYKFSNNNFSFEKDQDIFLDEDCDIRLRRLIENISAWHAE